MLCGGAGGCLGIIAVTQSDLVYNMTQGPLGFDDSFSTPLRNIRAFRFVDNRAGSTPQSSNELMLFLDDWSLEDGTKGNSSFALMFESRAAFEGARQIMNDRIRPK
jgi:hypothetical protein